MYQPSVNGFSERRWNEMRGRESGINGYNANPSFGYRLSKPVAKGRERKLKFEINKDISSQFKIAA